MTDKDFQEFMIKHVTQLTGDVQHIRQNIARLEFEHGEKLAALFDGQAIIMGKLDEHSSILDKHSDILDKHSAILDKHSAILDKHSVILDKHSAILADHTDRLQRIEDKVEKHDIQIQVLDKTKSDKRKAK